MGARRRGVLHGRAVKAHAGWKMCFPRLCPAEARPRVDSRATLFVIVVEAYYVMGRGVFVHAMYHAARTHRATLPHACFCPTQIPVVVLHTSTKVRVCTRVRVLECDWFSSQQFRFARRKHVFGLYCERKQRGSNLLFSGDTSLKASRATRNGLTVEF